MKKKVLVGMSGGVDSSVAVSLLKENGYDVSGITMKLWEGTEKENDSGCCSLSAVEDARRVAQIMNIQHYVHSYVAEFKEKVISYFVNEYKNGRTPNPCIACNDLVRFDSFLNKSLAMGFDYIATGHYAKVEFSKEFSRWILKKSNAVLKDQTYFLYNLKQHQLEHVLFPLGDFREKSDIRVIASNLELNVAKKPDSQEICFIETNHGDYISKNYPELNKNGLIVDKAGNSLGNHKGIYNYTVGKRKGLGISSKHPLYVLKIDAIKNQIVVGLEKDLYANTLIAKNINLIAFEKIPGKLKVSAKVRYSIKESDAYIEQNNNGNITVEFEQPQRAITPGQSVVFYISDVVIGGAIIDKVIN